MKMPFKRLPQGMMVVLLIVLVVVSMAGKALAASAGGHSKQSPMSCTPDPNVVHISDAVAVARITKQFGAARIAGKKRWERGCMDPNAPRMTSTVSQYAEEWSGYVSDVLPTPYVAFGVYGEFNVTDYTGLQPTIASWVGIGGYYSTDLIQAGYTTSQFGSTGKETFYELFPASPVLLWQVRGYFSNYEFVHIDFDDTSNLWYIYLDDDADPYYFYDSFRFSPDKNTAEWVEERSTSRTGAVPPTLQQQQFVGVYWTDNNGNNQAINSSEVATVRRMLMRDTLNGTNECLVPTGIGNYPYPSTFFINYQSSC